MEKLKKICPMAEITFLNSRELGLKGILNLEAFSQDFLLVDQPKVEKEIYKSLRLMDGTVHQIIRNEIVEYEQWDARIQYIAYA